MFILISILILPSHAAVKVVESTPSRLVLSWEISGFDTVSVVEGGGAVGSAVFRSRVSFDGGYIVTGDSGEVRLPGYSFYAGVPAQGFVRVSLEPEEAVFLRLNNPLPRNAGRADELSPSYLSSVWISEPAYVSVRDYRAAYFVVRPVIDAGNGGVRVLRRARIVIEFPRAAHNGASWEPRSDHERMARRLLLNFGVAQGWQGASRGLRKAASAEREPYPFPAGSNVARFRVGDGHRGGNEASTKENSLIRISGKRVNELFGGRSGSGRVLINNVALYASHRGEMAMNVPAEGAIPPGVFEVPLMRYDLNGDGYVDSADYFIAYASGASDWIFDAATGRYLININRYDDYRTYWLNVKSGAGLSMAKFGGPVFAAGEPVRDVGYFEDNSYLRTPQSVPYDNFSGRPTNGGIDWAWTRFSLSSPTVAVALDMPGADTLYDTASVRIHMGNRYSNTFLSAFYGADTVCGDCSDNYEYVFRPGARSPRNMSLRMGYRVAADGNNNRVFFEVNGIHLRYRRRLSVPALEGRLEVFGAAGPGGVRYGLELPGAGRLAYIVRVPAGGREITLVDTVRSGRYSFADTGGIGARYMVMPEENIVDYSDSLVTVAVRPAVSGDFLTRDLRGTNVRSDFLTVTHGDFQDAARKLAEHKKNMGFSNPVAVRLDDVMDQFGGGNTDPAALRNFLLYVHRNWPGGRELEYVVLMGSGHYDYKNISGRNENFMPIIYMDNVRTADIVINDSVTVYGRTCEGRIGDDYYTYFTVDTVMHSQAVPMPPACQHDGQYFIGRLPAKSLSEAFDMVDKIIETEDPRHADFGSWRNRALMVADDDQQGAYSDNIRHYESSEKSSAIIERNRPDADLRKLYMFEYPWDEHHNKPGVKRALINELNSGVSFVSWFGHGSLNQIADEAIFTRTDASALYNRKRYPLFSLFSCSINKFDQPGDECIGAMLVRQPRSGGIASVSSVRDVYANLNENLALPFYDALFDGDENLSIGAAMKSAKYEYRHVDNRYYVMLGDPSITLAPRNLKVELSVTDSSGGTIDTLKALQLVTVKGTVTQAGPIAKRAAAGAGSETFISLTLFNPPEDSARRKDGGKYSNPVYKLPGTPVFSANIRDTAGTGRFEHQALLPMNLAFGKPGVKLIAYAWREGEAYSGSGSAGGLVFEGSASGAVNDTVPPRISVRPVYDAKAEAMNQAGAFVKNRITSQLPLTFEILIEDSSGINALGTGPDEGLTMEIKGALSKRSVNHLFAYSPGNFRQGIATVTLEENVIRSGTHELIISAQDLVGNVARQSFTLDITDASEIKLDHVLNIPNPVRMGRPTRFYYTHSNTPGDYDVNVTIRIYSLGGRLLSVIRNPRNGEEWVPRDQRGNLLTPNVYLYQITATTPNLGKTVKSKVKKLAVHPPR